MIVLNITLVMFVALYTTILVYLITKHKNEDKKIGEELAKTMSKIDIEPKE